MSKLSTLLVFALLLSLALTYAARPEPTLAEEALVRTQDGVVKAENAKVEESCEELLEGKEECLMRRTLAAHIDYIYTQKHN
ncbi:Phytosulfokines 3 [Morella rubra]|uniref:Phytosulfokine n=1 Tax=Morella rubra TaxID=262757 RepID=A0A6A1UY07_9ROSI|nr:Phytosulfokines 3 [Morella rubra]